MDMYTALNDEYVPLSYASFFDIAIRALEDEHTAGTIIDVYSIMDRHRYEALITRYNHHISRINRVYCLSPKVFDKMTTDRIRRAAKRL